MKTDFQLGYEFGFYQGCIDAAAAVTRCRPHDDVLAPKAEAAATDSGPSQVFTPEEQATAEVIQGELIGQQANCIAAAVATRPDLFPRAAINVRSVITAAGAFDTPNSEIAEVRKQVLAADEMLADLDQCFADDLAAMRGG